MIRVRVSKASFSQCECHIAQILYCVLLRCTEISNAKTLLFSFLNSPQPSIIRHPWLKMDLFGHRVQILLVTLKESLRITNLLPKSQNAI